MKITETFLKGCFVIEPIIHRDERGNFVEIFNKKEFEAKTELLINFVQDNQSISQKGVVRALHMQKGEYSQAKLIRVAKGKVLDVVVDCRKESVTFGEHFSIELSSENNKQLFVPRNFLHGFISLEENTVFSYKCDNYYNKDAEIGVIYNDKKLNIDWKLGNEQIILSEKDKKLKNFKDLI